MSRDKAPSIINSLIILFIALGNVSQAQNVQYEITTDIKSLVIERAAAIFEEEHVIPEIGEEYATALRQNLASGTFDEITTGREFMRAMDSILWPIDTDGHVWINFYPEDIPENYSGNFDKNATSIPLASVPSTSTAG